jgi:ankyrin repeat protein
VAIQPLIAKPTATRGPQFATCQNGRKDYNMTALQCAARWGRERVIRLLLEGGADVNAEDEDDETALHMACNGHETVVRLLLEKRAQGTDI